MIGGKVRPLKNDLVPRIALAAGLALAAGGCEMGRIGADAPPSPSMTASIAAPADLAGRWALTTMGATCAVNIVPGTSPTEGGVRPEGGCAGNFYTTRKWTYEANGLVLRDHTGKPLAQLTLLGQGRYGGRTESGGQPVELMR
ncbi:MAG: AprI/Inh family metalloprotease inhibitor [Rhizobiales bacterium]|nr:AprI/Inh family metalloprotease inhibitor [Hyphomicrobiales bacterium]